MLHPYGMVLFPSETTAETRVHACVITTNGGDTVGQRAQLSEIASNVLFILMQYYSHGHCINAAVQVQRLHATEY